MPLLQKTMPLIFNNIRNIYSNTQSLCNLNGDIQKAPIEFSFKAKSQRGLKINSDYFLSLSKMKIRKLSITIFLFLFYGAFVAKKLIVVQMEYPRLMYLKKKDMFTNYPRQILYSDSFMYQSRLIIKLVLFRAFKPTRLKLMN